MARAPFDRTVDLIWGPGWPDAGDVRVAAMPARIVPDLVFTEPLPPMGDSVAYLTCDLTPPYAPSFVPDGPEQYVWTSLVADRVALVPGAEPTHYVVRLELRTRLPQPSYWRAHIAPLPTDPPTPCEDTYAANYVAVASDESHVEVMERIGPTTWVNGVWTLQAGAADPETGCLSTWTLTDGGATTWTATWNGVGIVTFVYDLETYTFEVYPLT